MTRNISTFNGRVSTAEIKGAFVRTEELEKPNGIENLYGKYDIESEFKRQKLNMNEFMFLNQYDNGTY
eukprot:CAMPEP_0117431702 /NCGR_PEP_ID=MMETSP0758-20121206/11243_1 /TAXON_ID=63605 /ORGANISM="Percolomonas cosmopolitus, Strain AE-1 (ATCC 50343)" /LENGTH=67 /DNA_ID=CAMNT_0005220989 /DNA_START=36 /DNA_END=236 /DNA_ORIENTATION=-